MDLLIAAIGNTVYPESDEDLFGPSVAYDENQDDPYPLPNATTSTTAPHSNQDHFHNGLKACGKGHQYSVPCARAVSSFTLALVTFIWCIVKFIRYTQAHQTNTTYLVVAGLAGLESLLLTLKWARYSKALWLHFAAIFLHVMQFGIVCLFYMGLALKLLRKRHLINRALYPMAGLVFAYFATVLVLSVAERDTTNSTAARNAGECRKPHWIRFSASQVALATILIVASAYLTVKLKRAKTDTTITAWKTMTLWSLVGAYTSAAVVAFVFDVIFFTSTGDCDTIFGSWNSTGYTAYQMTERLSMLFPIWVLLLVWKAGPKRVLIATDDDRAYFFAAQRGINEGGSSESMSFLADATE